MSATTTRERPILFSGAMVRAILDGRKTQTRRVVKPQPRGAHILSPAWGVSPPPNPVEFGEKYLWIENGPDYPDGDEDDRRCPYGAPGDRLWVRETWGLIVWRAVMGAPHPPRSEAVYRAGPHPFGRDIPHGWTPGQSRWRPSIHMPRWASRLTLDITDVRVERLHDLSDADAAAEGRNLVPGHADYFPDTWDRLNAARGYGWDANPWVWVITFRRAEP